MNIFFEECKDALGSSASIVGAEEIKSELEIISRHFLFSASSHLVGACKGRGGKLSLYSDIVSILYEESDVIVFWDNASVGGFQLKYTSIFNCLDDVLAVGFITYAFSRQENCFIELYGRNKAVVYFSDNLVI